MSAQHAEPYDPQNILDALPAAEQRVFLAEYRAAVEAAQDPAAYRTLGDLLHRWSLTVTAVNRPGYAAAKEAARRGTGEWADFAGSVAAVRGSR